MKTGSIYFIDGTHLKRIDTAELEINEGEKYVAIRTKGTRKFIPFNSVKYIEIEN
jgi:hypothetical protein